MKLIFRNKDVVSKKQDLINLYCFKSFPVFMGCTNKKKEEDIMSDMNWSISKNSGAIQLNPLLPLNIVYQEGHGSGCVGKIWNEHHKNFAEFVHQFKLKSVLEIGGLHGILSKMYQKFDNTIDWSIVEPNPIPVKGVTANFIKGYFDNNFEFYKSFDAIIHSHVFEHIYDPHSFMKNINNFLPDGKFLIFSLPNLEEMIKRKYNNALNFEHTFYLTEAYVEYFLKFYKFKVVKKKYFKKDHSIFYACIKDKKVKSKKLPKNLFKNNKKNFLEYINYYHLLIKNINRKIKKLKDNQKLYLFGAHVFSQYLISFGLNVRRIECILDNDNSKQGKRLYGTELYVRSPKYIKKKNAVIILKAGVYNKEIKEDILKNINSNTIFI